MMRRFLAYFYVIKKSNASVKDEEETLASLTSELLRIRSWYSPDDGRGPIWRFPSMCDWIS